MKGVKSMIYGVVVLAVIIALLTQEVDARRKILKGRKTVTRTYVRDSALPSWAYIILVALAQLIIGAILYVILKKKVIDPPLSGSYTPAGVNEYSK